MTTTEQQPSNAKGVVSPHATTDEKIMFYCTQSISTDDLLVHVDIDLDDLHNHLFDLQLSGKIVQDAVGLWRIS